ncbi:MAG: hypothetical protein ACPL1B_08965 [Thermoprotei archaeon]
MLVRSVYQNYRGVSLNHQSARIPNIKTTSKPYQDYATKHALEKIHKTWMIKFITDIGLVY